MNPFTYSEKELDILRQYVGVESKGKINYISKVNEYFKFNENSSSEINTFLGSDFSKTPFSQLNGKNLKNYLENIFTLYGIACKYGLTHQLPQKLYREEVMHEQMINENRYTNRLFTDCFKSCSKNKNETNTFKTKSSKKWSIDCTYAPKKIPFIDVKDLINCKMFSDEKEIILPPFSFLEETTDPIKENDIDFSTKLVDHSPELFISNPEYNTDISDSEFEIIANNLNNQSDLAEKNDSKAKLINYVVNKFLEIYNDCYKISHNTKSKIGNVDIKQIAKDIDVVLEYDNAKEEFKNIENKEISSKKDTFHNNR